jgi:WD40 repeat protein
VQELLDGDPPQIGPYRLVGRLGTGGMGKVFLGRSAGGRLVAVKVIRDELAGDADFRARFRREVAGARLVSGIYTAPVVNADLDGPVPWLATAYVAGPSLLAAVAGYGPLPAVSVRALAAALAEGLDAIHAAGVIHRDLKPANVLLAADGPRIIDFGIARAAEATALTQTGLVMGSPGFMSPEQAEGRGVGPPTDVFSLGAVLTFAATGEGPFGTGSLAAIIYRIVHGAPEVDKVPEPVRAVVERCLAKDPGQRPTPADLLAELGGADLAEDWLPAPITREFPAGPAQPPYGPRTVTSAPGQPADPGPAAAAVKPGPAAAAKPGPAAPAAAGERSEPAGSLLARLEHEAVVTAMKFSPDGSRLATASGVTVRLWDRAPTELVRLRHEQDVSGVVFSPDGSQVATRISPPLFGSRQPVMLWDTATGRERARLPHRHIVTTVSFVRDGTRIATVSEEKTARLWDVATGQEVAQLRHGTSIGKARFSPDGTRMLLLGDFELKASLWDLTTGREIGRLRHGRNILAVAFSPDSTRLVSFDAGKITRLWITATGREQPWGARTRLWDAASGREQPWTELMTQWTAAFSPDGTRLATGSSDQMVRLWEPGSGEEMARLQHDNTITLVKFSPDGTRLATRTDRMLRLWDPAGGQETARLEHDNTITLVTFSPDGTRLATCTAGHTIRLWDTASGREVNRRTSDDAVTRVGFSPDGARLLIVGGSAGLLLDAAAGGELTRADHHAEIKDVAFSPDGAQLATVADRTVYLWAT